MNDFCFQVTWRREDNGELTLKDNSGTKQLSKQLISRNTKTEFSIQLYSFFSPPIVTSFSGEVLKLTKLSRSEMGSYLCIASNGKYIHSIKKKKL